ncbi:PDDEXK family nuclease [Mastigocoleus testarum]|uniref:DUF1887 family protein n=1 Tax=Mastigocoleus testarum TaxID=996925 RepID=UPI00040101A5|nr:DUF1887 family protein [Mastigocoleus testarum]
MSTSEFEADKFEVDKFEAYKVDHLFLLIGENPLPNYVAAKLLLKEGGIAYLVHTTDTAKSATRLQKILNSELNRFTAKLCSLGEYESDAFHIQTKIRDELGEINRGKIGLNYTGGTKAMAVHSYKTAFANCPDAIFSYLDSRRLEVCIDKEDSERIRLKIKPDTLPVKLEKLFQLHGLVLSKKPKKQAKLPKLAVALAELFKQKDQADRWFDWYVNVFCKEARKKKRNGTWGEWKGQDTLKKLLIPLEKLPPKIIAAFKEEDFLTDDNRLNLSAVKILNLFTEIEKFCKWLDGEWLEDYVLEQVIKIAKDNSIYHWGQDFNIPLSGTEKGFQFDVAFTRSYRLFAISCTTTSKRPLCKSKLFEAYLRARQMGGDEARIALVCCSDDETLKAEILASTNDDKIRVFRRQDLTKLSEKFTKWIADVDREVTK